jgi:hypothetical protein
MFWVFDLFRRIQSFFLLIVLNLKGIYAGQMPTKPVRINKTETTSNTMASVPDIIPAKYNIAIVTAISILITLSAIPMFFFMILFF